MTTRERVDLLAGAYPQLFPRRDILRLLRTQLGHVDVLDTGFSRDGVYLRARAPKLIYHICAGNLAVSAWTSLAHGLLLGSHNIIKLPSERDDSITRREILTFVRKLPAPLRALVATHHDIDAETLRRADAVIAFGSDATMASLSAQIRWDQKFLPHGHALSLIYLSDPDRLTSRQARACATDILTYDQLGCLSPQAIYMPVKTDIEALGRKLSTALEAHWQHVAPKPSRALGTAARITEARDLARALGQRVWIPPDPHLGWTVIHDPDPTFSPSPLHGVIILRQAEPEHLRAALMSVARKISTVATAGVLDSMVHDLFLDLGVSRFCPIGRMQFPPLTWHHDGRAPLADLVTWVDLEAAR